MSAEHDMLGPLLPTSRKQKIGVDWSFPIGAQAISQALAGVPQFDLLRLDFRTPSYAGARGWPPIQVAGIDYLRRGATIFRARDDELVGVASWTVQIRAVPRRMRHAINGALLASGLARIRAWLDETGLLEGREGQAWYTLLYDDEEERLIAETGNRLLPQRTP